VTELIIHPEDSVNPDVEIRVLAIALHHSESSGYLGGGYYSFAEELKHASKHHLKFTIVENIPLIRDLFNELKYDTIKIPIRLNFRVFSENFSLNILLYELLHMCIAIIKCIFLSVSWIKKNDVDLICSPWERIPNVFSAWAISKLTNRPWTSDLCLTPLYSSERDLNVFSPSTNFRTIYIYFRYLKKRSRLISVIFSIIYTLFFKILQNSIVIAVSKSVAENVNMLDPRITIILHPKKHGIELKNIDSICCNQKLYDAIFAGALVQEKGIFDVIRAWRIVINEVPNARLVIIGRGNAQSIPLIINMLEKYQLTSNVIIPFNLYKGAPKREDLWEFMKKSKLLIYPSFLDSWSHVVMEALACGLPVVTYDTGWARNAYEKCSIVIRVPIKDVKSIAQKVIEMLNDYNNRVNEYSEKARSFITKFSYDDVLEAERRCYITVIKIFYRKKALTKSYVNTTP
jgi:glycosyltransferase involved in cell wall biosynthesis